MKTVLFVDDDRNILEALARSQRREPFEILSAGSAREAMEALERQRVDVVVSDEMMPGMLGSEFLSIVARRFPDTIRIILTGHASAESAVRAINEGQIYRFLLKPCHPADLAVTIRQALERQELEALSRKLMQQIQRQSALLQSLEAEHPGITQLKKDESGALILD